MSEDDGDVDGLKTSRIEALSDGIFGVEMTLLVLGISVPQLVGLPTNSALEDALAGEWSKLLIYGLSFVLGGVFWTTQHDQFHWIKVADRPFLWINILFLLSVVFIPFSTSLLGEYPTTPLAVMVYGVNVIVAILFLYASWGYATGRGHLVGGEAGEEVLDAGEKKIVAGFAVALLATAAALVSVYISFGLFILMIIHFVIPGRIDQLFRNPREAIGLSQGAVMEGEPAPTEEGSPTHSEAPLTVQPPSQAAVARIRLAANVNISDPYVRWAVKNYETLNATT